MCFRRQPHTSCITILLLFLSLLPLDGICQQDTDSIAAPFPAKPSERLLGDMGGLTPKMMEKGVILLLSSTHFYQGLLSGSGDEGFKYGGKGDAFLILNGEKLGLWKGFGLVAHGELRYGKTVFNAGGNILPSNTALLFPKPRGTDFTLSSLFFTQQLGEKTRLLIGRFNFIDFPAMNHYYGGRGVEGFFNLAFTGVPLDARTTPSTTTLGTLLKINLMPVSLSLGVWETENRENRSSFVNLFAEGISVSGGAALITKLGGRPGKLALGGTWSNLKATSLDELPQFILPESGDTLKIVRHSWVVDFTFDQNLIGPVDRFQKGWGLFGRLSVADGNPNPFRWSFIGGFSGCPFTKRPYDKFGIGYYHFGLSKKLKDIQLAQLRFQNEQGVEAYYSYAVTPWLMLTADVQVIDPFRRGYDNAVYGGLRAKIRL